MSLRTAVTALVQRRQQRRAEAAAARHEQVRAARPALAPTTHGVALGGQSGSTVA